MKTKNRIAVSVFITAFAFGLNITGVLPILGILNEKYQQYGTGMVQQLQTMPYLMLIVGSLLVGWLTTRISKKKIVITGLIVIGICGMLPFFLENFLILVMTRLLIGFGFGIVGPMNTAIITEFFPPEERASYMVLHVVGMGTVTMIGNLIGGILAGIGYRSFYLVYLIAFLAAAGIKIVLIETPPVMDETSSDMKLNKMVYVISLASFVHTLFINAYNTNIGIYILQNITDNPSVTGVVTAVNSAFALLVILFVPRMAGVYVASALCGVSLSCFMAMTSYLISVSVEKEAVAKASGMFSIIGGIGGLVAPIVLGNVATYVLGGNHPVNQFTIAFVGMLMFGIVVTISGRKMKEKNQ